MRRAESSPPHVVEYHAACVDCVLMLVLIVVTTPAPGPSTPRTIAASCPWCAGPVRYDVFDGLPLVH